MTHNEERRRSGDTSVWLQTAYFLDKYRLLVYLIGGLLIAVGFDFKTPAQAMKAQRSAIDSLHRRVDTVEAHERTTARLLLTNIQIACLDHRAQVACKDYLLPPGK